MKESKETSFLKAGSKYNYLIKQKMYKPFLSICVPSYNRPNELINLLNSIDVKCSDDIEVVVCEDFSPKRQEIRRAIDEFKKKTPLNIRYFENKINLGYDSNLIELISKSEGEYIMYMGDDDFFDTDHLGKYILFLKNNIHLGYILRRYTLVHKNGYVENYKYYNQSQFFDKGTVAFKELLRKSVFISGFCFKREYVLPYYHTNAFKGTLLYQLFICGELILNYPSAYCDIPITIMDESLRGEPEFGSSENEKEKYTPGDITIENSINFMKSYLIITQYFDKKYHFDATKIFLTDMSKYSYPVLSIQRKKGIKEFIRYNKILRTEIKINCTYFYYIYFYSLLIFGHNICNFFILTLKKVIGKTPQL